VSPSRPSFSPQPQVYPRASPDSTFERLPSRTNLIGPLPKPDLNSRPLNRLRPLKVSCLSFCNLYPLFSVACSLFSQNAGGGVPQALGASVSLWRSNSFALCFHIPGVRESLSLYLATRHSFTPIFEGPLATLLHLPLESTLVKVHQNKQLISL
jgi:hypothetical protein